MTIQYLPPGRPGESPSARRHRLTDTPEQARLRLSAGRMGGYVAGFAFLLALFSIHDALEAHAIGLTAHPTVHTTQGLVDVFTPSRRDSVFRVSRPNAGALLFKCVAGVRAKTPCPTPSNDWQPRVLTVQWITMPSLLSTVTDERVTKLAAGDEVLFDAQPSAVQQAELADLRIAGRGGWRVLGGLMLAFAVAGVIQRLRLSRLTRQIGAAPQRTQP